MSPCGWPTYFPCPILSAHTEPACKQAVYCAVWCQQKLTLGIVGLSLYHQHTGTFLHGCSYERSRTALHMSCVYIYLCVKVHGMDWIAKQTWYLHELLIHDLYVYTQICHEYVVSRNFLVHANWDLPSKSMSCLWYAYIIYMPASLHSVTHSQSESQW